MRSRTLSFLASFLLAATLPAQESASHDDAHPMSPEMAAMMAAFEAAGAVGAPHERLASMAGRWKVTTTMWMPGVPEPMKSTGAAERAMILGGRVLEERFRGEVMGESFEGLALTGWDNVTTRWWTTWMDSMSTGVFVAYGASKDDKTDVFTGSMADPMGGPAVTMRIVSVVESADREVHTFFEKQGDGDERTSMELVYERER